MAFFGLMWPDGTLTMIVHETIPKSSHEDVEVEVERVVPAFATGDRWKKLEEETGAKTWVLELERGDSRTLEITTEITYPEGHHLQRN